MSVTQIRGNVQIMDDTITNAKIKSDAAIASSKLADGANFIKKDGSVAFTADQSLGNHKITNLANGVNPGDAINKGQLDAVAAGLDFKESVRAISTSNIDLYNGVASIDGVALDDGDRVLVAGQTNAAENGIYKYSETGPPAFVRAPDADASGEVSAGMYCFVEEGTLYHDTGWVLSTNNPITLGTTGLTFVQHGSIAEITAGAGLTKTGNQLDVGAGQGIQADADSITVKLDGTTISKSANGIKVNPNLVVTDITVDDGAGSGWMKYDSGNSTLWFNRPLQIGSGVNNQMRLYKSGYAIEINIPDTLTTARTINIPNADGTLLVGASNPLTVTNGVLSYLAGWKKPCRVATTGNITLSGLQTIDGITVAAGDRVLVRAQSTGSANGLYTVASGAWSRSFDADVNAQVFAGIAVYINEGTTYADTLWALTTNDAIVLGSTTLTFTQFTGSGLNNSNFVDRETPSGLVNGSNTVFTLANTPAVGTEHVMLNGLEQEPGAGNDYTISGDTITFAEAPISGDKIRVSYRK